MNLSDSLIRDNTTLSYSEDKVTVLFLSKLDKLVKRDEIAQALWGSRWLEKYSEYMIDKTIYRLRKKIVNAYKIVTLKNRGYILHKQDNNILQILKESLPTKSTQGITPLHHYLEYMNNPKNVRKTLFDLFKAVKNENIGSHLKQATILVINSFSYDNIDAVSQWLTKRKISSRVIFSNFDDRAIKIHLKRINELNLKNFDVLFDDIRKTRLEKESFDLVINDFRLNFNTNHKQNIKAMKNTWKVMSPGGLALISVVVDPRYESPRFGDDQQKAPINKSAPATFIFMENLQRFCFTVPYYKKLFLNSGFKIIKEFDVEEGKSWYKKHQYTKNQEPAFRRFLLKNALKRPIA